MEAANTYHVGQYLFRDVAKLIDETRKSVAYTVNSALTYMFWKIGKRINDEILQHERAEYGSQIVVSLIRQLTLENQKIDISFENCRISDATIINHQSKM